LYKLVGYIIKPIKTCATVIHYNNLKFEFTDLKKVMNSLKQLAAVYGEDDDDEEDDFKSSSSTPTDKRGMKRCREDGQNEVNVSGLTEEEKSRWNLRYTINIFSYDYCEYCVLLRIIRSPFWKRHCLFCLGNSGPKLEIRRAEHEYMKILPHPHTHHPHPN
jgi:hypothetical protein